jgi:hypothetical protein
LFFLGVTVGALIENKRMKTLQSLERLDMQIRETQEILLPLANKITHYNVRQHHRPGGATLVDYNLEEVQEWDPEETMEIPAYESLTAELKLKEEKWLKEQTNLVD